MDHKLIAMKQKATVQLYSYSYQSNWTCIVESKEQELMFKINAEGPTPADAVNLAYERWLKLTGAVPEFIGVLPPPSASDDSQDGDRYVVEGRGEGGQPDDEIPF